MCLGKLNLSIESFILEVTSAMFTEGGETAFKLGGGLVMIWGYFTVSIVRKRCLSNTVTPSSGHVKALRMDEEKIVEN